ncbi:MAG: TolC family protein, partial [Verrucomicrobiota bacterium]
QWNFTDISLNNDDYYFLDDEMRNIKSQADFIKFGTFLRWLSVENSPELAAFDYSLGAQGEILRQKQRRYFLPEVSASLSADRVLSGSEFAETDAEEQLGVAVQLSFPLYEGGKRKADILKQKAFIRQVAAQREGAVQRIEQGALSAYHNLGAAHPNILLSRQALSFAEKNYAAVRDKYSLGAASILDLLDAQSALVGQKQQAATAVYSYLTQIHAFQRSIAWFQFNKTPAEKEQFRSLWKGFLTSDASVPPVSSAPDHLREEAEAAEQAAQKATGSAARGTPQARPARPTGTLRKKRRFPSHFRRKR